MRHTFLVVTVKRRLKSVYIYGSYRKIKTGVPLFLDHPVHSMKRNVGLRPICIALHRKIENARVTEILKQSFIEV